MIHNVPSRCPHCPDVPRRALLAKLLETATTSLVKPKKTRGSEQLFRWVGSAAVFVCARCILARWLTKWSEQWASRQTLTNRHRHRQTQTDTDKQIQTDRHRQTDTDTDRDRHRQTETDRQTDKQTDKHRETGSDTDRQTHPVSLSVTVSYTIWICVC